MDWNYYQTKNLCIHFEINRTKSNFTSHFISDAWITIERQTSCWANRIFLTASKWIVLTIYYIHFYSGTKNIWYFPWMKYFIFGFNETKMLYKFKRKFRVSDRYSCYTTILTSLKSKLSYDLFPLSCFTILIFKTKI